MALNNKLSKLLSSLLMAVLILSLNACNGSDSKDEPTPVGDEVEQLLTQMSLREKVGQMFVVRAEALLKGMDVVHDLKANAVIQLKSEMVEIDAEYPVGGIILYAHNIVHPAQLQALTRDLHTLSGHPLLYIDEEGGTVARIGNNSAFTVPHYSSMGAVGASGDPNDALEAGNSIGNYLNRYGLDVNLAPVADVNTNPENQVIGKRAFSDDPNVAALMVVAFNQGLKNNNILGCLKHFPGHGDTKADTHYGYAETKKTWQEMLNCEMIPFKAGIDAGADFVMTAHIATPGVTGNGNPATMSSVILQDKLRGELGYQNVIITDGMEMGAITSQYDNIQATIGAIKAGVDIVLGPHNYKETFNAVVNAVKNGELSEDRINQSVRRILKLKQARPATRREVKR